MKLLNFIKRSIENITVKRYYKDLQNNLRAEDLCQIQQDILFGNVYGTDLY